MCICVFVDGCAPISHRCEITQPSAPVAPQPLLHLKQNSCAPNAHRREKNPTLSASGASAATREGARDGNSALMLNSRDSVGSFDNVSARSNSFGFLPPPTNSGGGMISKLQVRVCVSVCVAGLRFVRVCVAVFVFLMGVQMQEWVGGWVGGCISLCALRARLRLYMLVRIQWPCLYVCVCVV